MKFPMPKKVAKHEVTALVNRLIKQTDLMGVQGFQYDDPMFLSYHAQLQVLRELCFNMRWDLLKRKLDDQLNYLEGVSQHG